MPRHPNTDLAEVDTTTVLTQAFDDAPNVILFSKFRNSVAKIAQTHDFTMTTPRFPETGPGPSPGAGKERTAYKVVYVAPTNSAKNLIGVIHLLLGAWVIAGGVFAGVFASSFSLSTIAPVVVLVSIAATMAVGGVMIRDGKRRGALLLVITDGLLLAAKLLGAPCCSTPAPPWSLTPTPASRRQPHCCTALS